jgi:hypothetical protein
LCYLLPPARMSVEMRQRVLVCVDAVGKMSLIDAIFMYVAEGALAVAWRGPAGSRVEIQTIPSAGFVSLFGSTILCLVFGHLVLFIHRVEQNQHLPETGTDCDRLVLRRSVSRGKRIVVDALLALTVVLLPCCFVLPVLTMHIDGAFRTLFVFLGQDTDITVNLPEILASDMRLSGPSMFENEAWKVSLTATAYIFCVILPVLMALELVVLWVTPLSKAQRFWGLCLTQTARAWAALDIVFSSMVIAYFQLPVFMKAVTTDHNQGFTHICSALSDQFGLNCFEVAMSIESGTVFIGLVSALLLVASIAISREADRSLKHADPLFLSVGDHLAV